MNVNILFTMFLELFSLTLNEMYAPWNNKMIKRICINGLPEKKRLNSKESDIYTLVT